MSSVTWAQVIVKALCLGDWRIGESADAILASCTIGGGDMLYAIYNFSFLWPVCISAISALNVAFRLFLWSSCFYLRRKIIIRYWLCIKYVSFYHHCTRFMMSQRIYWSGSFLETIHLSDDLLKCLLSKSLLTFEFSVLFLFEGLCILVICLGDKFPKF